MTAALLEFPLMAAPPAFQVFARDEYVGLAHLSPEQFAAHWRAMLWSWTEGPLPLDERARASVCQVASLKEFRRIWPAIAARWHQGPAGFTLGELEEKREKQTAFQLEQKRKAQLGGFARARAASGLPVGNLRGLPEPVTGLLPGEPGLTSHVPAASPEPALSSALSSAKEQDPDQKQSGDVASSRVLTRLAHEVLAELDKLSDSDPLVVNESDGLEHVAHEIKRRAAVAGLVFKSGNIAAAIDSARFQRTQEPPVRAGVRVARQAIAPSEGHLPRSVFNARMWQAIADVWPAPRFAAWRNQLVGLVYRDSFLRACPDAFELVNNARGDVASVAIKGRKP